jgi:uncharacterized protein YprB with RNaseH-like and TPR domain
MRTVYLDIETSYTGKLTGQKLFSDYKRHLITVLGVRVIQDAKDSFVQLINKDISKNTLLSAVGEPDLLVTYNGRSIPDKTRGHIGFDFPVIAEHLGIVLDKEFKHMDLCPVCWQHGLWGGQKAVERSLGLKRILPGRDGAWADVTWKKYEITGCDKLLKELLEYNREDVFMLRRIQEALNLFP